MSPSSNIAKNKFKNFELVKKSSNDKQNGNSSNFSKTGKSNLVHPSINDIKLAEINPDVISQKSPSKESKNNKSPSHFLNFQALKDDNQQKKENSINQSPQINKDKELIFAKKTNLKVLQIDPKNISEKKSISEPIQPNLPHIIDTFTYNLERDSEIKEELKNNSPLQIQKISFLNDNNLKNSPKFSKNSQKIKMLSSIFTNNKEKIDMDKIQLYLALYGPKKIVLLNRCLIKKKLIR